MWYISNFSECQFPILRNWQGNQHSTRESRNKLFQRTMWCHFKFFFSLLPLHDAIIDAEEDKVKKKTNQQHDNECKDRCFPLIQENFSFQFFFFSFFNTITDVIIFWNVLHFISRGIAILFVKMLDHPICMKTKEEKKTMSDLKKNVPWE